MTMRLCPSVLTLDKANVVEQILHLSPSADLLHLDVMDGKFVPATTFTLEESESIIRSIPLPTDAHLMVEDCDYWGPRYAEIGCASVTVHVEATKELIPTLRAIRSQGARSSIAIKPMTPVERYLDLLTEVDMVLVMTVEPGAGGQKFMAEMLHKVRTLRSYLDGRDIWLQVDGGINISTIEQAAEAGADTFVAGSAVFSAADPIKALNELRNAAETLGS